LLGKLIRLNNRGSPSGSVPVRVNGTRWSTDVVTVRGSATGGRFWLSFWLAAIGFEAATAKLLPPNMKEVIRILTETRVSNAFRLFIVTPMFEI